MTNRPWQSSDKPLEDIPEDVEKLLKEHTIQLQALENMEEADKDFNNMMCSWHYQATKFVDAHMLQDPPFEVDESEEELKPYQIKLLCMFDIFIKALAMYSKYMLKEKASDKAKRGIAKQGIAIYKKYMEVDGPHDNSVELAFDMVNYVDKEAIYNIKNIGELEDIGAAAAFLMKTSVSAIMQKTQYSEEEIAVRIAKKADNDLKRYVLSEILSRVK